MAPPLVLPLYASSSDMGTAATEVAPVATTAVRRRKGGCVYLAGTGQQNSAGPLFLGLALSRGESCCAAVGLAPSLMSMECGYERAVVDGSSIDAAAVGS